MENQLAPICLFTYDRLKETKLTVEALKNNYLARESVVFIFSDGPKEENFQKVSDLRDYLSTIIGFKDLTIIKSEVNKGLAQSIIDGISYILKKYDKIIVLEDDLITSPNFLDFMNQALSFYSDDARIMSINGYSLDLKLKENFNEIYYQKRPFPWGWGTWKSEWNSDIFFQKDYYSQFLNDEREIKSLVGEDVPRMLSRYLNRDNDSWYVRWIVQHIVEEKFSVYPSRSKVENIGFSIEGTHCKNINTYVHTMDQGENRNFDFNKSIELPPEVKSEFLKYFNKNHKFWFRIKLLRKARGRQLVYNEILDYLK